MFSSLGQDSPLIACHMSFPSMSPRSPRVPPAIVYRVGSQSVMWNRLNFENIFMVNKMGKVSG